MNARSLMLGSYTQHHDSFRAAYFLPEPIESVDAVDSVEMLGYDQPLVWDFHANGLNVAFPEEKPDKLDCAYCLKIKRNEPTELR